MTDAERKEPDVVRKVVEDKRGECEMAWLLATCDCATKTNARLDMFVLVRQKRDETKQEYWEIKTQSRIENYTYAIGMGDFLHATAAANRKLAYTKSHVPVVVVLADRSAWPREITEISNESLDKADDVRCERFKETVDMSETIPLLPTETYMDKAIMLTTMHDEFNCYYSSLVRKMHKLKNSGRRLGLIGLTKQIRTAYKNILVPSTFRPGHEACKAIARHCAKTKTSLVEVGAGSGFVANLLMDKEFGVPVRLATDAIVRASDCKISTRIAVRKATATETINNILTEAEIKTSTLAIFAPAPMHPAAYMGQGLDAAQILSLSRQDMAVEAVRVFVARGGQYLMLGGDRKIGKTSGVCRDSTIEFWSWIDAQVAKGVFKQLVFVPDFDIDTNDNVTPATWKCDNNLWIYSVGLTPPSTPQREPIETKRLLGETKGEVRFKMSAGGSRVATAPLPTYNSVHICSCRHCDRPAYKLRCTECKMAYYCSKEHAAEDFVDKHEIACPAWTALYATSQSVMSSRKTGGFYDRVSRAIQAIPEEMRSNKDIVLVFATALQASDSDRGDLAPNVKIALSIGCRSEQRDSLMQNLQRCLSGHDIILDTTAVPPTEKQDHPLPRIAVLFMTLVRLAPLINLGRSIGYAMDSNGNPCSFKG